MSVAACSKTKNKMLSYSRTPRKCNLVRRGKYDHLISWRGEAVLSMTSVSMWSNGKIWSSRQNWWEYVADKFTWRENPRSANRRVQRSFRRVNAHRTSVEERCDSNSSNAKSARSSNRVSSSSLLDDNTSVIFYICSCMKTLTNLLLFSFLRIHLKRPVDGTVCRVCPLSWRERRITVENAPSAVDEFNILQ